MTAHGGTDEVSFTLTVKNVAPTIDNIAYDSPIIYGESSVVIVTATDPIDSVVFAFDCDNDGVFEVGPSATNETTCSFATAGLHTVNVQVDDGDGGVVTDSVVVTVKTHVESIEDLRADVQALKDAGALNKGQANGIDNKLESAIKKLNQGNPAEAIVKLNEFITQANNFVTDGVLTAAQGQALIDAANRIIAAIHATN